MQARMQAYDVLINASALMASLLFVFHLPVDCAG